MLPNAAESVFGTEVQSPGPTLNGFARRRLVVLLALVAAACGSVGTGAGPSPSADPMHFDVTATETDHAVSMHVGQRLEVVLHGGNQISYQQVKSSDPAMLAPAVDPHAAAARGVTLAAFEAKTKGQVDVTAVGSPVCTPDVACPMYAILYTLTVTIGP